MKIWLDPSPTHAIEGKDCTGGGKGLISSTRTQRWDQFVLPTEVDAQSARSDTFQQSSSVYVQKHDNEHWLVCSPCGSGRIAVFDAQAMHLFQQFRSPTTISNISRSTRQYPLREVEQAVAVFLELGFLDKVDDFSNNNSVTEPEMLTAWMHVTNACNLRCQYCYIEKTSESMTEDTSRKAVDAIFRSAVRHGYQKMRLKYAGGEASLHMMRVIEIHDYANQLAQSHGIALHGIILSNGVALSERAIELLKSRHIGVMISLDGLGAYHDSQRPFMNGRGSFYYVARTINRLLAHALIPEISITVSRRNLGGLPDLIEYILQHKLPFAINYYRENEYSASFQDLLFEEEEMVAAMTSAFEVIEKNLPERSLLGCLVDRADMGNPHSHTCGVGQSYLVISQDGSVAKCHADMKRAITTISASDPLQVIRDDRERVQGLPVEEKEGCRQCEWRYWCTGGCPLLTYRATGRYDVKSPNCNIYKALFPKALRLEALRLLCYQSPIVLEHRQPLWV